MTVQGDHRRVAFDSKIVRTYPSRRWFNAAHRDSRGVINVHPAASACAHGSLSQHLSNSDPGSDRTKECVEEGPATDTVNPISRDVTCYLPSTDWRQ